MVLTPALPRAPGSDPDLYPDLALDDYPDPDPHPRLAGMTGEPDDIITWYVRPRRRRRRRRMVVAVAVLAALTCAGLLLAGPRPAHDLHPKAVIYLARARQQRRHQRIAQVVTDTIATVGGGAAAGLRPRWWARTPQPRRRLPELPGHGSGPSGLTGIHSFGWGCGAGVAGIAPQELHAWVICSDGTMFELNAATGTPDRMLNSPRYGLSAPNAVTTDGSHVWVTNAQGGVGSVTELNAATGTVVRVLTAARYEFIDPVAIAADGTRVWVANFDSVTEVNAVTGALIQVFAGPRYGVNSPSAIAVDGASVWVANAGGNSVTELNAATGTLVRVLAAARYGFNSPSAIAVDGPASG
jgi:hypothetical protein